MTEAEQSKRLESTRLIETRILESIKGTTIEQRLMDLAQIGGTVEKVGERVEVSRLAFSEEDRQARTLLNKSMVAAGMNVIEYPFGLVGTYAGDSKDSAKQPAVMMMSHFDSVPNGGAYDGDVGVISAIEVVRVMHEQGVRFTRPIKVLALTGEESSRYQIALLGSKMAFDGLTEDELQSKRPGDVTLEESLIAWGIDPQSVTKPTLLPANIAAVIELHIEQNARLAEAGIDLGIVEAISAPDRREIVIGNPLLLDTTEYPNEQYLQISVAGKADHSGATPMGKESRADGLLPMSDMLIKLALLQKNIQEKGQDVHISIGNINIEGQALNKIPGNTSCVIKIGGNDAAAVKQVINSLSSPDEEGKKGYIEVRNKYYEGSEETPSAFDKFPISLEQLEAKSTMVKEEIFYKAEEILPYQMLAAQVVKAVNAVATDHGDENIVGTVGTYNVKGGQIILGVDIRGTEEGRIQKVWSEIQEKLDRMNHDKSPYQINKLPSSAGPAQMDSKLMDVLEQVIVDHKIGSFVRTTSPAGQDSQVTARRGIPTEMIFIPSRNGGVSHIPEEYSTPDDLEKGAKALAALVIRLASAA